MVSRHGDDEQIYLTRPPEPVEYLIQSINKDLGRITLLSNFNNLKVNSSKTKVTAISRKSYDSHSLSLGRMVDEDIGFVS